MASGDTSMTLQSTTGLPTGTGITLTIDATDPVSGAPTPLLEETITGVVSGSTVTSLLRGKDGTTAQAHASGANVVMLITANLWNDWQTAYLTSHNQAGGIYATSPQILTGINDVNNNQIIGLSPTTTAVNAVTVKNAATGNAPQVEATGSDTNINLALTPKGTGILTTASPTMTLNSNPVWQYLGSATYTGGTVTSTGATPTEVTNLSVGVTIPSGCTAVRVTIDAARIYPQSGSANVNFEIYSGASAGALTTKVGGTVANSAPDVTAYNSPAHAVALIKSPSSGAIYYTAAIWANSSNAQVPTSSTLPAFIVVECC